MCGNPHQNIVRVGFGVFHEHIEVAVIGEGVGIDQFEFRHVLTTPPVFLHQPCVGIRLLGIFVEHLQIRVSRCCIQIVIQLFDIFAVVALTVG